MNMESIQPKGQPGSDDTPGRVPAKYTEVTSDSKTARLEQYVTYEEMQELRSGIAQLLHKMLEVCLTLTAGQRTGNGNGN